MSNLLPASEQNSKGLFATCKFSFTIVKCDAELALRQEENRSVHEEIFSVNIEGKAKRKIKDLL